METNALRQHPLWELCNRAHYNVSFSPEKRADMYVAGYEAQLAEFKELCGDDAERFENIKRKYTEKFTAHMHAKSRCLSSMITGPAKFPVRRAEKANAAEHKRSLELVEFVQKVKKRIDREKNPVKYGISSDDADAVAQLKAKIDSLEMTQIEMKAVNKAHKVYVANPNSDKANNLIAALREPMQQLVRTYQPRYSWEPHPFPPYQLTNNNANIKRLKDRLKGLEANQERGTKEHMIDGVKVVENTEANRIQLFFDGKPERSMIDLLKSRGFKWSPSQGCWQRMLNNAGRYAAKQVLQIRGNDGTN